MSSLIIPKKIQEWHRTYRLFSFQRESQRGTGNVVFAHSNKNPRGVQDMSSLFMPKKIQDRYRTCGFVHSKENPRVAKELSLCSFQRESMRGAGHVVFVHAKENPRGVQDMQRIQEGYNTCLLLIPKRIHSGKGLVSLFIPKRIQEGYSTCLLCSFQRESISDTGHVIFAHSKENRRGVHDMSLFITKMASLPCTG